jgi:ABC-type nitrate/sulfonate/bicarbonate transport system substrate-binding protein
MLVQPKSWISGPNRSAAHRVRVSAAHAEWNHVGIALTAMEEGFFRDEGITDLEVISFWEETGALVDREQCQVDLLAEGTVDMGIDPRTTFVLEAAQAGRPVSIIAARRKTHAFVLIGQKGLTSVEDLRGQDLYESAAGGATDVMLRQTLRDFHMDPDKDVRIHYGRESMHDSASGLRSFLAGTHGPVFLLSHKDEIARLQQEGYPILADLRTRFPSRHDRVTAANSDFVEAHPEIVRGFLKGMMRACRWVLDLNHTARFKEIVRDAGFLTSKREAENFDQLWLGWQERVSVDLDLPADGIAVIVKEEMREGKLPPSFAITSALQLDPLHAAQREVGLREE